MNLGWSTMVKELREPVVAGMGFKVWDYIELGPSLVRNPESRTPAILAIRRLARKGLRDCVNDSRESPNPTHLNESS